MHSHDENFDMDLFHHLFINEDLIYSGSEITDYSLLPQDLLFWAAGPRRVFHLRQDICELLEAILVNNVRWKDLEWPLDSFIISLEKPISDKKNSLSYDTILIYHFEEKGVAKIGIRLFPKELREVEMIDDKLIKQLEKTFIRGYWIKWALLSDLAELKRDKKCGMPQYVIPKFKEVMDLKVRTTFTHLSQKSIKGYDLRKLDLTILGSDPHFDIANQAVRIIVGFCLLLSMDDVQSKTLEWQTIKPRSHQKKRQGSLRFKERKIITDEAMVHYVLSKNVLSQQAKQIIMTTQAQKAAGQYDEDKAPFWRIAHHRRPPGKGHDINFPKTVKVKATIVNADMLLPGELPGGAITIID